MEARQKPFCEVVPELRKESIFTRAQRERFVKRIESVFWRLVKRREKALAAAFERLKRAFCKAQKERLNGFDKALLKNAVDSDVRRVKAH